MKIWLPQSLRPHRRRLEHIGGGVFLVLFLSTLVFVGFMFHNLKKNSIHCPQCDNHFLLSAKLLWDGEAKTVWVRKGEKRPEGTEDWEVIARCFCCLRCEHKWIEWAPWFLDLGKLKPEPGPMAYESNRSQFGVVRTTDSGRRTHGGEEARAKAPRGSVSGRSIVAQ